MQLKYILKNPLGLVVAILNTFVLKGRSIIETTFGSNLEWLDINTGDLPMLALVVVFCIFVYRHKQFAVSPLLKRTAIFIFTIITAMFVGIEYLTWTPVGATSVEGIQGRYFLPMLFMVPLFFMKASTKKTELNSSLSEIQKFDNSISLPAFQFIIAINLIAAQAIIIQHLPL